MKTFKQQQQSLQLVPQARLNRLLLIKLALLAPCCGDERMADGTFPTHPSGKVRQFFHMVKEGTQLLAARPFKIQHWGKIYQLVWAVRLPCASRALERLITLHCEQELKRCTSWNSYMYLSRQDHARFFLTPYHLYEYKRRGHHCSFWQWSGSRARRIAFLVRSPAAMRVEESWYFTTVDTVFTSADRVASCFPDSKTASDWLMCFSNCLPFNSLS